MDGRIGIELRDQIEQFFLRGGGWEFDFPRVHPEGRACLVLVTHIGLGGGILSDEDHGESGGDATGLQGLDARLGFEFHFGGDRLSVNELHGD